MYLVCNECALCACVSYVNYVYVIRGLIRNTDISQLTQHYREQLKYYSVQCMYRVCILLCHHVSMYVIVEIFSDHIQSWTHQTFGEQLENIRRWVNVASST